MAASAMRSQFVQETDSELLHLSPHPYDYISAQFPKEVVQPQFLPEFRLSNSPDDLTLANIQWIEGDEALEVMTSAALEQLPGGHAQQYVTQSVKRIVARYDFVKAGGWVTFGCTLDGKEGEVAYFKPAQPRSKREDELNFSGTPRPQPRGFEKNHSVVNPPSQPKTIKYETPQGTQGTPLLVAIPWRYGYRIATNVGVGQVYLERFQEAIGNTTADPETHPQGSEVDRNFYRFVDESVSHTSDQEGQTIATPVIPIFIVEGFKKALALIAEGKLAIALRGISMWHKKGSRELHDVLGPFVTPGRRFYICFDQDAKPVTVCNVRAEALKLGSELEKQGCLVGVLHWEGQQYGKGIDDVLFGHWPGRAVWLTNVIDSALTLKQYRRFGLMARAFAQLTQLEQLSYPIERDSQGNYLPPLPPLAPQALHVVNAGLGAGKTLRIGHDWVRQARDWGWFTVVISPMNSLGQQTAQRWKLPHIHDFSPKKADLLWDLAHHDKGVVLCADSLHRLPEWFWQKPVLLVLDEANQVAQSLTGAGTLGERQSDILQRFTRLAEHAATTGALVLAEDGIADRAVRFIQTLSQVPRIRVFRHQRQQEPWQCTLYSGQLSGFRARVLTTVMQGERLLFVTSSQREGHRLEHALASLHLTQEDIVMPQLNQALGALRAIPQAFSALQLTLVLDLLSRLSPLADVLKEQPLRLTRIDSDTNESGQFSKFFCHPDHWIEEHHPDVLILSPSAKSGISIELPYFDAVYGYFPALAGDTHWQLLGRYRQAVPRHCYVPPFIHAAFDEGLMSPGKAKSHYYRYAQQLALAFGLGELLTHDPTQVSWLEHIQTAVLNYHAAQRTVQGAQKAISYHYLKHRLEKAGHQVTELACRFEPSVAEQWKAVQDDIWQEEAALIASLPTTDEQGTEYTADWAYQTLSSLQSTRQQRIQARKVLWRIEFPGILFDDKPTCYEALCRDHGAMRKGVLLQIAAQNLTVTRAMEKERVEKILKADIKALHRLPKKLAKASIIAQCGVLELLNGQEYSNHSPVAMRIKERALANAGMIYEFLGLNIKPEQTPAEIANKLLRKLGLEINKPERPGAVVRLRREGGRGQQQWIYAIDLTYSEAHLRLLQAAQRKLQDESSHNSDHSYFLIKEMMTTTPSSSHPPKPANELSHQSELRTQGNNTILVLQSYG